MMLKFNNTSTSTTEPMSPFAYLFSADRKEADFKKIPAFSISPEALIEEITGTYCTALTTLIYEPASDLKLMRSKNLVDFLELLPYEQRITLRETPEVVLFILQAKVEWYKHVLATDRIYQFGKTLKGILKKDDKIAFLSKLLADLFAKADAVKQVTINLTNDLAKAVAATKASQNDLKLVSVSAIESSTPLLWTIYQEITGLEPNTMVVSAWMRNTILAGTGKETVQTMAWLPDSYLAKILDAPATDITIAEVLEMASILPASSKEVASVPQERRSSGFSSIFTRLSLNSGSSISSSETPEPR